LSLPLAEKLQVVAASFIKVAYEGYRFSLEFDEGGKWSGYAPGLVPGWLFGRKMVRRLVSELKVVGLPLL
jgi:hypothetical protein